MLYIVEMDRTHLLLNRRALASSFPLPLPVLVSRGRLYVAVPPFMRVREFRGLISSTAGSSLSFSFAALTRELERKGLSLGSDEDDAAAGCWCELELDAA